VGARDFRRIMSRQAKLAGIPVDQFARVHNRVLAARSIRELFDIYYEGRLKPAIEFDGDDAATAVIRQLFTDTYYAGAASFFQLLNAAVEQSGDDEEAGSALVQRLFEELAMYVDKEPGKAPGH
jgi:hypothetical protein